MDNNEEQNAIVVMMTAGSKEEAVRLADMLVGHGLAACVQVMPEMESIYRWKGQVQRDAEFMLLAKSVAGKFEELERAVREVHSYETPEIIAIPALAVSEPYLSWLFDSVRSRT
jgi:periplasmic divalent cation tolerance protein